MITLVIYITYLAFIKVVYFVYYWNEAGPVTCFNLLIQLLY